MIRKKYCVIKPEHLKYLERAIADQEYVMPYQVEHGENQQGEKYVRVWINLNHAAFAESFVTPLFNQIRQDDLASGSTQRIPAHGQ